LGLILRLKESNPCYFAGLIYNQGTKISWACSFKLLHVKRNELKNDSRGLLIMALGYVAAYFCLLGLCALYQINPPLALVVTSVVISILIVLVERFSNPRRIRSS
jgi:hypothetical protein